MPRSFRWGIGVLVAVVSALVVALFIGLFCDPVRVEGGSPGLVLKYAQPDVVASLVLALVQLALCVLARTGRNLVRVLLTVSTVVTGLSALLTLIAWLSSYSYYSECASRLGGHLVVPGGWSVALALCGVAAAGAVAGVVLLYLPTTNTYYREIRRLRRAARTAEE